MTTEERHAIKFILCVIMFYITVSALSGCAYVEYQHIDATPLVSDGAAYDLVCAGLTTEGNLTVSGGICSNLAPYGGEFLTINARYTFNPHRD